MAVRLSIDGKEIKAQKGEYLLEVASREGIEIPHLCYRKPLRPLGACRLCIVEVDRNGRRRTVTACNYPVEGEENVLTSTAKIKKLRKIIFELILSQSPSSPELIRFAIAHSINISKVRFKATSANLPGCIQCGLCVRMCEEVAGVNAISFTERGGERKVKPPFGEIPSECIACGLCAEVCPTGVISIASQRIKLLMRNQPSERFCRYSLMNLIPQTVCSMNYNCSVCEVEQRFRTLYEEHPLIVIESFSKSHPKG